MKTIKQITATAYSLFILTSLGFSQSETDPDNTLEEKTIFTILEEKGETQYFGHVYKNKKKGIGTEFFPNGDIRTGYFENDEFLGEYIVNPPWHMIDIACFFTKDIEFNQVSVDLFIKDDISNDEFLYIAPFCGSINGIRFYAGLQTQCGGYVNPLHNEQKSEYSEIGKAMIFSRWQTRDVNGLKKAKNGVCESSGYEGDFISVRNSLKWETGTYTLSLINTHETVEIDGALHTFIELKVYDHQSEEHTSCGKLTFPGKQLILDKENYLFVELYSELTKISDTPKGTICVGNFKYIKPDKDYGSKAFVEEAYALYDMNSPQWVRSWYKDRMFNIQFGEPYVRRNHWEYKDMYTEQLKDKE